MLLHLYRGTMGVNSLPQTVTRQRRDCDLNPGPSARESSTLTTKLPSHPSVGIGRVYAMHAILPNNKCHFSVELKKLPSTEDRVQTLNATVATDYSTLLNDLTLTLALTFQSAASCGHTHTRAKVKVEGQSIQKIEWKQADERTRPISLPYPPRLSAVKTALPNIEQVPRNIILLLPRRTSRSKTAITDVCLLTAPTLTLKP